MDVIIAILGLAMEFITALELIGYVGDDDK